MANFATDSFTGTSGTELSAYSGNWTKHTSSSTGTLVITDANRLRKNSGNNSEGLYYHSGTPSSADYTVSADLVFISSAAAYLEVCGRMSTSANTYYRVRYNVSTGGWELHKKVNGSLSQLGTTQTQTFSSGTKNVKLRMSGSTIELYKEGSGTATISVTDTTITAAGKSGLRSSTDQSNSSGLHLDNFSADDISSGTTFIPKIRFL